MKHNKNKVALPNITQVEAAIKSEKYKKRRRQIIVSTVSILLTVAAISIIVATFLLPAFQIYGSSMSPTFTEDDIVISVKSKEFERGDIIAFYYEGKVLVKRCIAFQGDWVNLDDDGNIYVNGNLIDEPYVAEKMKGECTIELPYQVPAGKYFVCGDNRAVSIDSRSAVVGCITEDKIIGKIVFRLWPLGSFGRVN